MPRVRPLLLLLSLPIGAAAQPTVRFVPSWGHAPLVLDVENPNMAGDGVKVTTFRFYVGVPTGLPGAGAYVYHLVDAADSGTWTVPFPAVADHFLLGVDSATSTSGVFGGDLDPTKGMYWAWNSGYINLKLEGACNALPYPSKAFELHLGGHAAPYGTSRRIAIARGARTVRVDVQALLAAVDLHTRCNVMSPGAEAVRLSDSAVTMFQAYDAR